MKTTMQTVTSHAIALVLGMLLVAGGCLYLKYRPSLDSVLAKPAAELAKEKPTLLTCKPVLVYRDKVETKLGLPTIVTGDPNKHVTASTKVPGDEYPHTVTSVYDQNTGATDMFVRKDKLPWLATNNRYEIGFSWLPLTSNGGEAITKIDGRAEVLQIKRLRFAATGEIYEQADQFNWQIGMRTWVSF